MQLNPTPINMDAPGDGNSCWDTWLRAMAAMQTAQELKAWDLCARARLEITDNERHLLNHHRLPKHR